jgi:hypothetical protein
MDAKVLKMSLVRVSAHHIVAYLTSYHNDAFFYNKGESIADGNKRILIDLVKYV